MRLLRALSVGGNGAANRLSTAKVSELTDIVHVDLEQTSVSSVRIPHCKAMESYHDVETLNVAVHDAILVQEGDGHGAL